MSPPLSWCPQSQGRTQSTLLRKPLRFYSFYFKNMFFSFLFTGSNQGNESAHTWQNAGLKYAYMQEQMCSARKHRGATMLLYKVLIYVFYSFLNVKNYCCFVRIICTMFPEECSQIGKHAKHADPICLNKEPQVQYHLFVSLVKICNKQKNKDILYIMQLKPWRRILRQTNFNKIEKGTVLRLTSSPPLRVSRTRDVHCDQFYDDLAVTSSLVKSSP